MTAQRHVGRHAAKHDLHAESSMPNIGHRFAQHTVTNDSQVRAVKIIDREIEEAECAGLLPVTSLHCLMISKRLRSQGEDQREGKESPPAQSLLGTTY